MARGLQIFRQGDVAKAIKAAQSNGLEVQRFEIDRAGTIVIITGNVSSELAARDARRDDGAAA
jgi:hypothetical protein